MEQGGNKVGSVQIFGEHAAKQESACDIDANTIVEERKLPQSSAEAAVATRGSHGVGITEVHNERVLSRTASRIHSIAAVADVTET